MALWYKVLQVASSKRSNTGSDVHQHRCIKPQFDHRQIRLVVHVENDIKGRILIFDSKVIKKVDDNNKPCCTNQAFRFMCKSKHLSTPPKLDKIPQYKASKPSSDVKVLEEMVFGSVAMSYQGSALKIHTIKSPPQLMLTKVFIPDKSRISQNCMDSISETGSFINSSCDLSSPKHILRNHSASNIAQSVPVDVPLPPFSSNHDSGIALSVTSSGSYNPTLPSSASSSASISSLQRRFLRNQSTSIESILKKRSSLDSTMLTSGTIHRKDKIGVAILFQTGNSEESVKCFENFFFSHITIFESHVTKLERAIERAYFSKSNYIHLFMLAFEVFQHQTIDLYTAPRLNEPAWLSMVSSSSYRYALCEKYLRELMTLYKQIDTKSTHFFLSSLITAVLTHHLGWVPTVTPADGSPSPTYLDKHSAKWLDTLSKTHPYNPLWAQLSDLYGAIGHPLRISRTVIVGKKSDLINRFIYVLSYFIRCSEVCANAYNSFLNLSNLTASVSCDTDTLSSHSMKDGWSSSQCPSPTPTMQSVSPRCLTNNSLSSNANLKNNKNRIISTNRMSDTIKFPTSFKHDRLFSEINYESRTHGDIFEQQVNELLRSEINAHRKSLRTGQNVCNDKRNFKAVKLKQVNKSQSMRIQEFRSTPHAMQSIARFNRRSLNDIPLSYDCDNRYLNCKSLEIISSHDTCRVCPDNPIDSQVADVRHLGRSAIKSKSEIVLNKPACSPTAKPHSVLSQQLSESALNAEKTTSIHDSGFSQMSETSELQNCSFSRSESVLYHKNLNNNQEYVHGYTDSSKTISSTQNLRNYSCCNRTAPTCERPPRKFFSEPSHSILDEYLDTNVETKTIDEIPIQDIVLDHCVVKEYRKDLYSNSFCASPPPSSCSAVTAESSSVSTTPQKERHPSISSSRRHVSGTPSCESDNSDPLTNCSEVFLPQLEGLSAVSRGNQCFSQNFGRSLMATHTSHYLSDFVLHGTSDPDVRSKISKDLSISLQQSVLDEAVSESVVIVADTNKWQVSVLSSNLTSDVWVASNVVSTLLESVFNLWKLKMSPEFCLMHLEDRLQEIYFKSCILSELLYSTPSISLDHLHSLLEFDDSDLPLLYSVATSHAYPVS